MAKVNVVPDAPLGEARDVRPVTVCKEPPVRQSPSEAIDINVIMAKYDKSGLVPFVNAEALYADVSTFGDYRDAIERVKAADDMFNVLPLKVRQRFNFDPAAFVAFCMDEKNRPELIELGLVVPAKPVSPVVPAAAPAAAS